MNSCMFKLLVACIVGAGFSQYAIAEDNTFAMEFYRQGEHYFHKKRLDEAKTWYQRAIQYRPDDGPILLEKKITDIVMPRGRLAEKQTKEETLYEDYAPNERLKTIDDILEEQNRLSNPPNLDLIWRALREPTRNNILDGGEDAEIVLEVKNTGKSDALDVLLNIKSKDNSKVRITSNRTIGEIKANASEIITLGIAADYDVDNSSSNIAIEALDKSGIASNTLEVMLETRPHQPARLELDDITTIDQSHDARIEPFELIEVNASIVNKGYGVAEGATVDVELGDNMYFAPHSKKYFEFGKIYPSETRNVSFMFQTIGKFKDKDEIPVTIRLKDRNDNVISYKQEKYLMYVPKEKDSKKVVVKPKISYKKNDENSRVDINIPVSNRKNPNAIAVVIGNRNYKHAPNVDFALNDAAAVKKYLIKAFGYSEENIIYIEDATSAEFQETFGSTTNFAGKLFNYIRPNGVSDVFIYYSGHGAPDVRNNKGVYFVPTDSNPDYISTSGYSLDTFYNNLSKLNARSITIVLDTCFSGYVYNPSVGKEFIISGSSPALLKVKVDETSSANTVVFTSTGSDQISIWYEPERHSLFTYYFLKGLQFEGADKNRDKKIMTGEMADYISKNVTLYAKKRNIEQRPSLQQRSDLVLVDYNETQLAEK